MNRKFKNVLVTGGLGFIGSQYVKDCIALKSFETITIVDSCTYASNTNLIEQFQSEFVFFYNLDINEEAIKWVIEHNNIDLIVHFAAESHVTNSIGNPSKFILTNINGTQNLLESAKLFWSNKKNVLFHHVSTDEVYGSISGVSITESKRYNPGNPYSASKASSDHIVEAYGNTYGIPYTISHGCNTFGEFQNEEKFIPLNIKNAVEGRPMLLHAGKHHRQWVSVGFHSFAIQQIISNGKINNHYNINLDGSYCIPNTTIIEMIKEFLIKEHNIDSNIQTIKDRPGNDKKYWSKSKKLISTNPDLINQVIAQHKDSFRHQFKRTVKFYVDKFQGEKNA